MGFWKLANFPQPTSKNANVPQPISYNLFLLGPVSVMEGIDFTGATQLLRSTTDLEGEDGTGSLENVVSDDDLFWEEDMYQNEDVVVSKATTFSMTSNDQGGTIDIEMCDQGRTKGGSSDGFDDDDDDEDEHDMYTKAGNMTKREIAESESDDYNDGSELYQI